jgi:hypothetical protein
LPEEIREQMLDRLIDEAVSDGADDFGHVVYEMIVRKQRWFAQIKRLKLKYNSRLNPTLSLSRTSSLPPRDAGAQ